MSDCNHDHLFARNQFGEMCRLERCPYCEAEGRIEVRLAEATDRAVIADRRLSMALAVCDEQVNDDGLWFIAATAPEAYLQAGLRRLHFAIEGNATGVKPSESKGMHPNCVPPCGICEPDEWEKAFLQGAVDPADGI